MKAVLVFDQEDPDDRAELRRAVAAPRMLSALWEFNELFRKIRKYEDHGPCAQEMVDRLESAFHELLDGYGVRLEDEY
jgi:hypothetical protein